MTNRRRPQPVTRGQSSRSKARDELALFESEYTIERVTQRDLVLDLGAALWIATAIVASLAGSLDPAPTTPFQSIVRVIIIASSAVFAVAQLTVIRRFDDQRTVQLISGTLVLGVAYWFTLSFFGPGAVAGFFVSMVAVSIYSGQFLNPRGLRLMLIVATAAVIGVTIANVDDPTTPFLVSNDIVVVTVIWGVALALYELRVDRVSAIATAERTAFSDPLTGLPNSRMIRRRAEALLDERNERINRPAGIVLLDLDGFRAANMLRGHRDGDRLLCAAAGAMAEAAGEGQLVARTGSDEFTALIPDADSDQLEKAAARFRAAVLEAIDREEASPVTIDASVGTAVTGPKLRTFEELVREADHSMYREKASHEREVRPRAATGGGTDGIALAPEPAPVRPVPTGRFDHLRWSNRPAQVRFAGLAWAASTISILVSSLVPDTPPVNWTVLAVLVPVGLAMSVFRYVTPPSVNLARQLFDNFSAGCVLAVVILSTGGPQSSAWPIALFLLIYAGWFLPLRWVIPGTLLTLSIVMSTLLISGPSELTLFNAVSIFGGAGIAIALLVVLYYNHYYLLRAGRLTDQLATLDPRANTNNRRAFEERMRSELEQLSYGDTESLAVVMIDLGNFKSVSANYGRRIGDRMLALVADALEQASREGDTVARLGGDEFGIVAPGVDAESARALAGRLVSAVTEAIAASDLPSNKSVRASAGFALYGMHGRTTDELVTAADIALTAAKTAARDGERVSSFVVAL